jgi:hypothetical protein
MIGLFCLGLFPTVCLDLEVDLDSMNGHVQGRLDAEPHLGAVARKHRDLDVVADHDALSGLPRQDEHERQRPNPTEAVAATAVRRSGRQDTPTAASYGPHW